MGVGGPDEGADPDDGTQTDLSDALDADPGRQNANTSPLTADDLPDRPLTDADAQDGDEEELETAQR